MKKLLATRRLMVLGLAAVLGTAALFYANPPTPGRAFVKNADVQAVGANHKHTPGNLLW
jgi:hypothetical protein